MRAPLDVELDAWVDESGRVGLDSTSLLGGSLGELPGSREPIVTVHEGAVISDNGLRVLKQLLESAALTSATVTSGRRDSGEQARVMFNLIARNDVAFAKRLYSKPGRKVVDVYAAGKASGQTEEQIRDAMRAKIIELGPANVSKHTSDRHDVFDVAPSSIANPAAFRTALDRALASGLISKYLPPPGDPAFHIEVPLVRPSALAQEFASAPSLPASVFAE
jgi:hypothetical protein